MIPCIYSRKIRKICVVLEGRLVVPWVIVSGIGQESALGMLTMFCVFDLLFSLWKFIELYMSFSECMLDYTILKIWIYWFDLGPLLIEDTLDFFLCHQCRLQDPWGQKLDFPISCTEFCAHWLSTSDSGQMSVRATSAPLMNPVPLYVLDSRPAFSNSHRAPGLETRLRDTATTVIRPWFGSGRWVRSFPQIIPFAPHQQPAS